MIAWLWARTVTCPNPACGAQMPLVRSFELSKKPGKKAWVEPEIDYTMTPPTIGFAIANGKSKPQDGTVNRQGAKCLACGTPVPFDHVRSEGKAHRMGEQLMAIVAEGHKGRVYLAPGQEHVVIASHVKPEWMPQADLPYNPRDFKTPNYGLSTFGDLFTTRQLVALTTLSDLISEARDKVVSDARIADFPLDGAYADAVATYLALAVDRLADRNSTICSWDTGYVKVRNTFARQAIPMVWDFAEANPFSESTGNFLGAINWVAKVIEQSPSCTPGEASQRDAMTTANGIIHPLISTDPPYYDNIGYADLSDFFYVWLRRSLKSIYPELFRTMLVPKAQELVATPYRFEGSKLKAQHFFETGLQKAFEHMRTIQSPEYPLTVYYAFKQAESETETDGKEESSKHEYDSKVTASTGWETMLEGLISSGFAITGTWPMRTEMANRSVGISTNALASSIVLVCRPREERAPLASRRQFMNELKAELPLALKQMQHGSIAPVDLAQASIGPGMAIYSKYRQVVEADGTPIRVRTALQLINRALDEVLAEQEGESDVETRWAIAWFETYTMEEGPYGQAETLSKAKNTALHNLVEAGILEAKAGKVRLLKPNEYASKWPPAANARLTAWEVMQRAIYALDLHGYDGAGNVLGHVGDLAEVVRDLAYRLYAICERKGWAQEALSYNMLITSWSNIRDQAHKVAHQPQQATLI